MGCGEFPPCWSTPLAALVPPSWPYLLLVEDTIFYQDRVPDCLFWMGSVPVQLGSLFHLKPGDDVHLAPDAAGQRNTTEKAAKRADGWIRARTPRKRGLGKS